MPARFYVEVCMHDVLLLKKDAQAFYHGEVLRCSIKFQSNQRRRKRNVSLDILVVKITARRVPLQLHFLMIGKQQCNRPIPISCFLFLLGEERGSRKLGWVG